jgi:WD40 repeat protein
VFSPDGTLVAAMSGYSVRVWDVATGELRLQLLDDVDFDYEAYAVAFSPDGAMLAVGTGCQFGPPGSASVKLFDAASGLLRLDIAMPPLAGDVDYTPLVSDLDHPDGTLLLPPQRGLGYWTW